MLLVRLTVLLPLIVLAAAMIGTPEALVRALENASADFADELMGTIHRRRRVTAISAASAWYVRACGLALAFAAAAMLGR